MIAHRMATGSGTYTLEALLPRNKEHDLQVIFLTVFVAHSSLIVPLR